MYITYTEYLSHGGTLELSQQQFARIEEAAATVVDKCTPGRLARADFTNRMINMMVELIDAINEQSEHAKNANISSVSNDGYSVSYVDAAVSAAQHNSECKDIVFRYATEYTYRGVDDK